MEKSEFDSHLNLTEKCSYTYHLPDLEHRPHCESDGTFAAKQCKGDMIYGRYSSHLKLFMNRETNKKMPHGVIFRCFCYSETGKRIFGWDWRNNDADNNMTCGERGIRMQNSSNDSHLIRFSQNAVGEEQLPRPKDGSIARCIVCRMGISRNCNATAESAGVPTNGPDA